MKRIEVIHNGKRKSIPANEARVLLLLNKATLVPAEVNPEPEPIKWPEPAVEAKWPFPKSDESAEVSAAPEEPAEPAEVSRRTGKPKRQYHRRDMRAEGTE